MTTFHLARVYDAHEPADAMRVLADRLWPRGVSKAEAALDLWAKDVAPSTDLRHEIHGHESVTDEDYATFRAHYLAELEANGEAVDALVAAVRGHDDVVLLTATKDPARSQLPVLREVLVERLG
ncbi:DUF488 domain-containing protein [Propionibacteriaceae bacterium G1746]|uniref:DUF488 domain-containing protein n=1 Tax=Aestuariimicrobium sp. G57 TaxID=3418485 RepID=UPI003C14E42C